MCFAQKCLLPFELDPPTPFWNPAKWVVVVTFDWGSYWHKVNVRFQGYPTWPYLARPSTRPNYCIYSNGEVGGPVRRGWDMFGQITFSNISFYWPQDQESTQCHSNLQKNVFLWKNPSGHPVQSNYLPIAQPDHICIYHQLFGMIIYMSNPDLRDICHSMCCVQGHQILFFGLNFVFLFNISNIF